jgi:hypothetical protein
MTDDEIEVIREQRVDDKMQDLEVEAVKLPSAEGEEADEMGSDLEGEEPAEDMEMASDDMNTSGLPLLAGDRDVNFKTLSISDDSAPIKAQNFVNKLAETLFDEVHEISEDETPAEKANANSKRKNKKGYSDTDHLKLVSSDSSDVSDSISHPYAEKLRKQKEKSERKKDINPLKDEYKSSAMYENDEFMSDFIDTKMEFQARMTSQLRSTLKSLENKISNNRRVISETDNSSEDEI